MTVQQGVLIVGGYGHVGRRIAARLVGRGMTGIRIAGRNGGQAQAVAGQLGCEGMAIDVAEQASWAVALRGIGTVIVCIDLETADFAAEVLGRGLAYVDISATDAVLRRVEQLHPLALRAGGMAVLSVGLAPGLSNLMAQAVSVNMTEVAAVEIAVLLGLGDDHGAAAIDWTLEHLPSDAQADVVPVRFGRGSRPVPTIPFAFADQHVLHRRQGLPATTRLGFASFMVTGWSLGILLRLSRRGWFRRLLRKSMQHIRLGSDRAALAVTASGTVDGKDVITRMTLEGRAEAELTALVASEVAGLLDWTRRAGVWHINELWELDKFLPALAQQGVELSGPVSGQHPG